MECFLSREYAIDVLRRGNDMILPSWAFHKWNGAIRLGRIASLPLVRVHGDRCVTEFPKSGGSWIGQMISSAGGIAFPRNRLPARHSSILHGHYLPTSVRIPGLAILRDGRDVMVSWYHHCLFRNDRDNKDLVEITRRVFRPADPADVQVNLADFIEYAFTRQSHPGFSWSEFAKMVITNDNLVKTSYEEFRCKPVAELERVMDGLELEVVRNLEVVVEEFSFHKQSGRAVGVESKGSFMRKGIVGDWKNYFTREAREVFDDYAGETLIELGYEDNRSWV